MWGYHIPTTRQLTRRLGDDDSGGDVAVVWCSAAHALVCPWCWAHIARCWVYSGACPLVTPPSSLPPSPSLHRYPRGYVKPIIRSVFDIMRGDIGVPSNVGVGGVGNNRAGRRRRIHTAAWSIRVWRVLAWLWDPVWRMCGV